MEGNARTWFTPKQKAELWERWKGGQCVADIARALERRNKSGVFSNRPLPDAEGRALWGPCLFAFAAPQLQNSEPSSLPYVSRDTRVCCSCTLAHGNAPMGGPAC